jgi:DNA-binding NarL/FixJ family response regulator
MNCDQSPKQISVILKVGRKMTRQVSPVCSSSPRSRNGTCPSAKGTSVTRAKGHASKTVRVMLLLSTSLDCESLSALLSMREGIRLIGSSSDLDFGLARCRKQRPKLLIVDPSLDDQAIELAVATMRSGFAKHVIVLDDRVHECLLAELLPMPSVSYMTRHAGADSLCAAVMDIASGAERVFDPAIDHRVLRTPTGLQLELRQDAPSVAALTDREREVMRLLAQGKSVRDCARQMYLAASTIDNHKSRLMKKLQIHKAAELIHLAIRDGLIRV